MVSQIGSGGRPRPVAGPARRAGQEITNFAVWMVGSPPAVNDSV